MKHKFVARLLTADDALVGWSEVWAEARPQQGRASCPLIPVTDTRFLCEIDGQATKVAVHWTELDVARVIEIPPLPCTAGGVLAMHWTEPVWLVAGMKDVVLPAVTVRAPITVSPVAAGFGMVGQRP